MEKLVTANTDALKQMLQLIEAAPEAVYRETQQGMTSPVGRHVRHVLDHYVALQTGLAQGQIDYDQRSRDSAVEQDAALAKQHIGALIAWIKDRVTVDRPLKMKTEVSVSKQESVIVESTLRREMIYLLNHTLHHTAYVSLALRILGVTVDRDIGVAPATRSYLRDNDLKQAG